jgi:D-3-phosphoglycerate dehydrogenase
MPARAEVCWSQLLPMGGVRRPVATSVIGFVLALSQKLLIKDGLTREGRWGERSRHIGMGLVGRTLGVVGLGNIGREVFRLAAPFGMRHLAADPYVAPDEAGEVGASKVELDVLMRQSDFIVVCCGLVEQTRNLINADRLRMMKPTAFLINVARGPIVDQQALTSLLREGRIQGAALDVFEQEPIDASDPLLELENVILTPHSICWTDECFLGNGRSACQSIVELASGRIPENIVNVDAAQTELFQEKMRRLADSE